jgi:hypothetical protein
MNLYISPTAKEETEDPSTNRTEKIPASANLHEVFKKIFFAIISNQNPEQPVILFFFYFFLFNQIILNYT